VLRAWSACCHSPRTAAALNHAGELASKLSRASRPRGSQSPPGVSLDRMGGNRAQRGHFIFREEATIALDIPLADAASALHKRWRCGGPGLLIWSSAGISCYRHAVVSNWQGACLRGPSLRLRYRSGDRERVMRARQWDEPVSGLYGCSRAERAALCKERDPPAASGGVGLHAQSRR